MYKLLIVDDEPVTADGLLTAIQEMQIESMELFTAYSSLEALEIITKHRIDIIVSDIIMPVMSGLELQKHVKSQWPKCKFILLTCHDDFSFIQQALECEGIDYLLKDENEDRLKQAIERAIRRIDEESDISSQIVRAEHFKKEALPCLQRDFFLNMLAGNIDLNEKIDEQFNKLNINMYPQSKVFVFLLRIDDWGEYTKNSDRDIGRFTIWNIIEELLESMAKIHMVNIDKDRMFIIAQPKYAISNHDSMNEDDDEKRVKLFINESYSDIQRLVRMHLNIKISIVASNKFIKWDCIRNQYLTLNILMNRSIGIQDGIIAVEKEMTNKAEKLEMDVEKTLQNVKDIIRQMDTHIELSQESEFFQKMEVLKSICCFSNDNFEYINKMIYFAIIPVLLSHIAPDAGENEVMNYVDLNRLIMLSASSSWYECIEYLNTIAEKIFEGRKKKSMDNTKKIILDIQKYIYNNLQSDVTLTSIANEFSYNYCYLSQLYKNITGELLSDYINKVRLNRAMELLKKQEIKINTITELVGFKTPSYFTRFFKKSTGYTPQEYRNKMGI
jgi:Response regulator containing CheY-like receiver domain and AraC-type DNA-binding domain